MIPAPAMRLSNLLRGAGVTPLTTPESDPVIRQVGLDSRSVGPDSLFCALRGLHSNGEQFVQQAVRQGASAVLAASPRPADLDPAVAWLQVDDPRMQVAPLSRELYGRPDEAMKLVGITGTNGKTTTAYMVDAIVRAAGRNSGRVGTIDYAWNDVQRPALTQLPKGRTSSPCWPRCGTKVWNGSPWRSPHTPSAWGGCGQRGSMLPRS